MERQGEGEGYRRDEALMAVARLSISDAEFLNGLRRDLRSTLWSYGFSLSPVEIQEIREFIARRRGAGDDDYVRDLRAELEASSVDARIWRNN